jgi:hypothetical protein
LKRHFKDLDKLAGVDDIVSEPENRFMASHNLNMSCNIDFDTEMSVIGSVERHFADIGIELDLI